MYRYLLTLTIVPQSMKTPFIYLFLLGLLISCKNERQLTLAYEKFSGEACGRCPQISVDIPLVAEKSKLAERINSGITEEISSILLFGENEELRNISVDKAISSFIAAHDEIKALYADETELWEAKIKGKVTYEDKNTLTIALNSYLFTGGAHGYKSIRFLNFDKETGKTLEEWQIFNDKSAFKSLAENAFRKVEGIPLNESINSTGFMFERDSFSLPENIGFTQNGIKLLYNQYEVASYADGPIEILLPYKETQKFLRNKVKTEALITTTSFEDSE